MPVAPKPSPSVPPRRGPVRSDAAIAHRWKDYERRLVKRIRIAGGIAVLQGVLGGLYAFFARDTGLGAWIVGAIGAISLAAAVGIFLKIRIAGIVAVALAGLNLASLIWMQSWKGLLLPIVFLLLYIDGMRALFAWSRMRATVPEPTPDLEALS